MSKPAAPLVPRFMKFVEMIPESGCWIWLGCLNNKGYGRFTVTRERSGELAHRVSYQMFRGPLTPEDNVLHRCDVRCCVNPHHFFLGTIQDNSLDMMRKGRGVLPNVVGVHNPSAKLTEQQVSQALKMRASGMTLQAIGDHFGVTLSCIWRLVHGKTWKHI